MLYFLSSSVSLDQAHRASSLSLARKELHVMQISDDLDAIGDMINDYIIDIVFRPG